MICIFLIGFLGDSDIIKSIPGDQWLPFSDFVFLPTFIYFCIRASRNFYEQKDYV